MGTTRWTVDGWTGTLGAPVLPDEYGCYWHVTAENGWRGAPAARRDRVSRSRRSGELSPRRTWRTGRVVELSGVLIAPNHDALVLAMERWGALLGDGLLHDLTVDEDGLVRVVSVGQLDENDISPTKPTNATFTLSLVQPDPRKYDGEETVLTTGLPAATFGASVPMEVPWEIQSGGTSGMLRGTNTGSADTEPVIEIAGPVVNPRLEHLTTGRTLGFLLDLADGDVLTIRPADGTVFLNGVANRRNAVIRGSSPVQAWTFPPGSNEVKYRAESSTGGSTATIRFRSAHH